MLYLDNMVVSRLKYTDEAGYNITEEITFENGTYFKSIYKDGVFHRKYEVESDV